MSSRSHKVEILTGFLVIMPSTPLRLAGEVSRDARSINIQLFYPYWTPDGSSFELCARSRDF